MQIAQANPQDARAIAEIHVATWRAAYASILPADYLASLSVESREAMWSECIASGTSQLLVAKDNGLVKGWLSFGACRDEGAPASEAEVWALYVSPESWSTGTGCTLWLEAKSRMLQQQFTSCSLWVFPQNVRAIKFYEAAGLVRDPSPPKSFKLGGIRLQMVRYACQLDDSSFKRPHLRRSA